MEHQQVKSTDDNAAVDHACPRCSSKGQRVGAVTVRALVCEHAQDRIAERDYRFCDTPDCEVVYFAADATPFLKPDVNVRVGVKETSAPRTVCYCFDHSIETIEQEVAETGRSSVLDAIKAGMQAGCWCETSNPQGACCLGAVGRSVQDALDKYPRTRSQ